MADKVNYATMSDAEINSEVAKFKYPTSDRSTPYLHRPDVWIYHPNATSEQKDYCNSWADAGPIIQRNKISLIWVKTEIPNRWDAGAPCHMKWATHEYNPLRAAMETFLLMQEEK